MDRMSEDKEAIAADAANDTDKTVAEMRKIFFTPASIHNIVYGQ